MPLNQRELTTELCKLQTKVNKTEEELRREVMLLRESQENKDADERAENIVAGSLFILGDLAFNFILPLFGISEWLHISPTLGPIDWFVILLGGRLLWKGYRK